MKTSNVDSFCHEKSAEHEKAWREFWSSKKPTKDTVDSCSVRSHKASYSINGLVYCGRCHAYLGAEIASVCST